MEEKKTKNWTAAINRKYTVVSRRMTPNILGTPGNPFVPGPLAVTKMVKNVKRSAVQRDARREEHQGSRGKIKLEVGW